MIEINKNNFSLGDYNWSISDKNEVVCFDTELWFDVEAKFGVELYDKNYGDGYINLYIEYNVRTGETIYFGDIDYEMVTAELNCAGCFSAKEIEFIRELIVEQYGEEIIEDMKESGDVVEDDFDLVKRLKVHRD